jgi:hypothetical protein
MAKMPARRCQALNGTATSGKAMAVALGGLGVDGKLLVVGQSASRDPSPDPEMCPDHWLSSLLLLLDHVLRLLVALHHGGVVRRHEAIQLGELGCFRTVPRAVRLG